MSCGVATETSTCIGQSTSWHLSKEPGRAPQGLIAKDRADSTATYISVKVSFMGSILDFPLNNPNPLLLLLLSFSFPTFPLNDFGLAWHVAVVEWTMLIIGESRSL